MSPYVILSIVVAACICEIAASGAFMLYGEHEKSAYYWCGNIFTMFGLWLMFFAGYYSH